MSLFQIHSYTTRIARRLADSKDCERSRPNTALVTYRAPPAYRSESAQELRKAVADVVRQERRS